jgi:DNA invertase Pin-like site-specific DNA recombinase
MMMLGYARVSTNEQDTAAQVSALKSAGCEKIFREKTSGGRWDRPELIRLLDQLEKVILSSSPVSTDFRAPYGTS